MTIEKEEEKNKNIYEPQKPPEKETSFKKLKDAFLDIPGKIDREFEKTEKTGNTWLDCFVGRVAVINGLISASYEDKLLNESRSLVMKKKIKELMETIEKSRNGVIENGVKQKLLDFLTWENIYGTRIDELKEAFNDMGGEIKNELNRPNEFEEGKRNEENQNNWLYCFSSRACEIVNIIYLANKELGQNQKERAAKQIELLNKRLVELKMEYQGKDAIIPEEIKQELLNFLTWKNIFGE